MKKLVSLLDKNKIDYADYQHPEVLMVLKRKWRTQKDWFIASFKQYQFTEDESQKVEQAILNGDLRITDLLERPFTHYFWSFFTFKWGEILAGGKRLAKQEVLQIAHYSSEGLEFARTPEQNRNRLIKGVPLVAGKVLTSMALCMVFCLGLLSTVGAPFGISLALATLLSGCNGVVCLLSRGKAMLDSAGFQPTKQKTFKTLEENIKEKTLLDKGQKLFFGIVTLLACISAGISGYAGLVGLLSFLGVGMLVSNPLVLAGTIGLSLIAAISFYSFQAVGIRENYTKFKNLFIEAYNKPYGLLRCVLLGTVSTLFLSVYATLTWFTTVSGVNKLFGALGGDSNSLLAHFIALICTSTTMVVNTFSQVYKVFNPNTYVDLKEKFASIYQAPEENPTQAQKIKYGFINMLKLFALIGDSFAYSVAGGIRSGIHIGETLGEALGQKLALTITMAVLSPIILVFVSVAFTWPTVFPRKKALAPPSTTEKSLLVQADQSNNTETTNNTLPSTNDKTSNLVDFKTKKTGPRFFDTHPTEEERPDLSATEVSSCRL
ncbi:hypothetical protein [Legionella sp. km772]|uniref:hypothetical protein n=1 Tax=Legionella sp. km772 TaxID=2498111 RepID=UPI000F8EE677|nr:hypothetical protein [Legionella sp. km772]RUR13069.1 hypothetical protein ELY15_03390 [Legionella sp. km772]